MTQAASNYLADKEIQHVFGIAPFTAPTAWYVGLATAEVLKTHTGSTAPETDYVGYGRSQVTAWQTTANPGEVTNTGVINFPECTGTGDTLTHWFIADAATGGNILFRGEIPGSGYVVSNGVTPFFQANALTVTRT